jgi:predicted DNA-binding protein with PD1-like motif
MLSGRLGRICFSRIIEDEDLLEKIKEEIEKANIKAGFFNVIGALKKVTLGYYEEGEYKYIQVDGPLEIASCMGNIAVGEKGETMLHAHIVVSDRAGRAFGGHLMKEAIVGATAELTVIEATRINLVRAPDKKTKLNLLKLR